MLAQTGKPVRSQEHSPSRDGAASAKGSRASRVTDVVCRRFPLRKSAPTLNRWRPCLPRPVQSLAHTTISDGRASRPVPMANPLICRMPCAYVGGDDPSGNEFGLLAQDCVAHLRRPVESRRNRLRHKAVPKAMAVKTDRLVGSSFNEKGFYLKDPSLIETISLSPCPVS